MAFSVSIGDGILLSTLALRLGRAFRSGLKSAPSEFQEVENQLYSLSQALEILATDRKIAREAQDDSEINATSGRNRGELEKHDDKIALMLSNCRITLSHLELIVDKYTELKSDNEQPDQVGDSRWRKELKENWKKLRWTTEGGDLTKLRGNLAVHIDGLNLAISAINRSVSRSLMIHQFWLLNSIIPNSSQTKKVRERVEEVHEMLKEVHEWFTANLKYTHRAGSTPTPTPREAETGSQLPATGGTFTVSESSQAYGADLILRCAQATFHPRWHTDLRLFQCQCQQNNTSQSTGSTLSGGLHEEQLRYLCTDLFVYLIEASP